jgi:hypothetical protein
VSDHAVRDRVTIRAEESHVERLIIVPVMTLEASPAATPRAGVRTHDQAELLAEGGGISDRSRPNPSGFLEIGTDLEVALESRKFGMQAVALGLFHGGRDPLEPGSQPTESQLPGTAVPTPSEEPRLGTSERILVTSLTCHLHSTANSMPCRKMISRIGSCFGYAEFDVPDIDSDFDDGILRIASSEPFRGKKSRAEHARVIPERGGNDLDRLHGIDKDRRPHGRSYKVDEV